MKKTYQIAYIFLAPALLTLTVFFFLPVLAALGMSFTDFDIYSIGNLARTRFVFLQNYQHLLHDPLFWKSLLNTAYFVLVAGPLTIFVSLFTAMALQSASLRFKSFFRLAFFLPVITNLVAIAVVWRYLYHPRFGLLNYILGLFHWGPIDWLGDPHWAMPALILLATWKNFGYFMMIYIAGLQTIPGELYEASSLDGANWWRQQWHVTVPLLAPATLLVTIMTAVGYLQFFAEPYIMTQGGPLNATLSVVLYLYDQGFRWWKMGYSASIAFVLFSVVFLAAVLQLYLGKRREAWG